MTLAQPQASTPKAPVSIGAQTPMMRQYFESKAAHPDALMLFHMGDFYETFYEDARTCAAVLDLTLTTRDKDKGEEAVPMAGFPVHALAPNLSRLIAAGLKVAVCDQLEDPKLAKGLVNRVVADVEVVAEAYASARRICAGAPLVATWHKQWVRRLQHDVPLSEQELRASFAFLDTEDYREGLSAFLEKRKPDFRGR